MINRMSSVEYPEITAVKKIFEKKSFQVLTTFIVFYILLLALNSNEC